MLPADPQGNDLLSDLVSLVFRTSGPAFWQIESTAFDRRSAEPLTQGMEISYELRTPNGNPADSIKVGDEVVLVIKAHVQGKALDNAALTALLPGGFEMVLAEGGDTVQNGTSLGARRGEQTMNVSYAERREDRLLIFTGLSTQPEVYRCRIRAVVRGTFVLPPAYGEAMYNPTIRARSDVGSVHVEKSRECLCDDFG